jgi:hypothetical protein
LFAPKKDEVTGVWRKLHNEELHDLYCSPTIVINPLAFTAVHETAELTRSVNTQPAVRRSEPSVSCF